MTVKLKWKYLTLIFAFILFSVLGQTFYAHHKHQQQMAQKVETLGQDVQDYFADLVGALSEKYNALILHYAFEPQMTEFFHQRNRLGLLQYIQPDYSRLQKFDPDLHIMHFIDTENRTLLRLHQPDNFDDDLTRLRPMIRDVNRFVKPLEGFEVGKNGITYRIASPLINRQGEHFGILEFGIRPNYFVQRLVERFGVESMILVATDSLGVLEKGYGFRKLDRYSIIQSTDFLSKNLDKIDLRKDWQVVDIEGRTYMVLTSLNQLSHQNEIVSKVVIARDITAIKQANNLSLLKEGFLNLFVLLFLWGMIYAMFSRYTRALEKSYETIQALHLQSTELKTQANTDELTGLYNRRFFNESLEKIMSYGKSGTLLFFDIDHFKHLNDAHGHQAGDQVLVELAKMLTSFFRQDDLIVRWGGEEFAVFINNMPESEAYQKAERFRHFVETSSHIHQPYAFTISGGVTQINPGDQLEDVFQRADERLYAAKEHGRNQIIGEFYKTTRPGDKEV